MDLGDREEDATIDFSFSTRNVSAAPATLAGTPIISVYKANGTTQSVAGVTLTVDFDVLTGLNHVRIDTSADAFYAAANDYEVVITQGTVNSVSVVGTTIATFSIENRFMRGTDSALLSADINLTAGAVDNVTTVATTTTNTDMRGTDSAFLAASAPTNFSALGISVGGAIDDVILTATTTTNSDMRGTDSALLAASAPTNWSSLLVNVSGHIERVVLNDTTTANTDMRGTNSALLAADINLTAGTLDRVTLSDTTTTNTDMRGTDSAFLAASAPTNFSSMVISGAGAVDALINGFLNSVITETSAGRIANNFDFFYDNANAQTAKVVDNVGAGGGGGLTAQQTRDAMKLAPTGGAPGTGSIDEHLDDILLDTDTTIPNQITGLNDFDPATDTVANVTLVATVTTNTDMRGTNSALLAASAPTNWSSLLVNVSGHVSRVTLVDTVTVNTDMRGTDGANTVVPDNAGISSNGVAIAALNDISVVEVLTTQMTEAYAADGTAPTLTESLMLIQQVLTEFAFSGTSNTVKKLDGAATAATMTLDDGTNPTSSTRTG